MATVNGTAGNDFIHVAGDGLVPPGGYVDNTGATNLDDTINSGGAGVERIFAGDGGDTIRFAGDYTAADLIDGGSGSDALVFAGQTAVVFAANSLTSIEHILLENFALQPGFFGEYALTFHDANVAAGGILSINGANLVPDISLYADLRAETDASKLNVTGGLSGDYVLGRATGGSSDYFDMSRGGNDTVTTRGEVYFGAAFTAGDHVDGMDGGGRIRLDGDYSGGLTLTGSMLTHVRQVFLGPETGSFSTSSYNFTLNASAVSDGFMTFYANRVQNGASVTLDASAVVDRQVNLLGGGANDHFSGGGGADRFDNFGNGSDYFAGGGGDDQINALSFASDDELDGGSGFDTLGIVTSSAVEIVYSGTGLRDVERITTALSAATLELTVTDGALAAGATLQVDWSAVTDGTRSLTLDGSQETDGRFVATGGAGADVMTGGGRADVLDGRGGADTLTGAGGNDWFYVDSAADVVVEAAGEGTKDRVFASASYVLGAGMAVEMLTTANAAGTAAIDLTGNELVNRIIGNAGANVLDGGGGDDVLAGGAGADVLRGRAGNDTLDGGTGADAMRGYTGNDVYFVDNAGDTVTELAGEGIDRVTATVDFTLGAEVENLVLRGDAQFGTGNGLDNAMLGSSGKNTLSGLAGADTIDGGTGFDTLEGGNGNDILTGGVGKDRLTGGAGLDQFVFRDGDLSVDRTLTDIVIDFSHAQADRIKLSAMDANTGLAGDQKFAFIGTGAFTGVAGQLHCVQDGGNTFVEGDTNGDGAADFSIRLNGLVNLVAADFVL